MVAPITMFQEGGPFMYLLILFIPAHLVLTAAQILLAKRVDLVPLLWASVIATVMVGVLGSVSGMTLAFQAVAHASAEMKSTMMAAGVSVALHTTAMGLMVGIVNAGFAGIASSIVRTVQHGQLVASKDADD